MIGIDEIEEFGQYDSRKIVGVALERAYAHNPDLVVFYADVGRRFNLEGFQKKGGRCIDTGIAEQGMIGAAAGFAHECLTAFAISYAPFLAGRVFDQIKVNVGEMGLPLKLIGAISGLTSGGLGSLATCFDDIAMMRTIPGLIVVSPADCLEVVKCIEAAAETTLPVYIRLTGGKPVAPVYHEDYSFSLGRAVPLREGDRIAVISTGAVASQVLEAADRLSAEGNPVAVLNMHTVKPLDTAALSRYLDFEYFVTVEEHSIYGGVGSAIAEYLAEIPHGPNLCRLGIEDKYFAADHYEELLEAAGLSAKRIYCKLTALLGKRR